MASRRMTPEEAAEFSETGKKPPWMVEQHKRAEKLKTKISPDERNRLREKIKDLGERIKIASDHFGPDDSTVKGLQERQQRLNDELQSRPVSSIQQADKKAKKKNKGGRRRTGKKVEESYDERRFQQQCFLVDNIDLLKRLRMKNFALERASHYKNGKQTAPVPRGLRDDQYDNFTVLKGANPQEFITKATTTEVSFGLFNATPEELSALVPVIKLWKVYYPTENHTGHEVPFNFENFLSEESIKTMTETRATRGQGAGIKSFEWDLEGTNLFEADKLISARMTLIFQDMNSLTKILSQKDGFETRYLDLFHANRKYIKPETQCGSQVWNEKHFRIKATVGWAAPENHKLHAAAKDSGYTFFLSLIRHDINFNENATIEVTLQYQATVESILSDFRSDILLMNESSKLTELIEEERCHTREVSSAAVGSDGIRDKAALNRKVKENEKKTKELKKQIIAHRTLRYGRFLKAVNDNSKVHYIEVSNKDIGYWKRSRQESAEGVVNRRKRKKKLKGNISSKNKWHKRMEKAIKSKKRSIIDKPAISSVLRIHYITLGNILDTALSVLGNDKNRLAEIRTLVTDFEYIDPRTEEPVKINLSDVPISLDLFQTWFYDECVDTERKSWKLKAFIKSLVDKLFLSAISERCFPCVERTRKPRLNMSLLQIPLNDQGKCNITGKADVKESNADTNSVNIDDLFKNGERRWSHYGEVGQYLFFHLSSMSRSLIAPKGTEQTRENTKNGIPSLYIGSSRGLVKRISFQKEDNPQIAAFRITEGEAQLGGLREIYNASVDMVGNNFFKPGSYVWIDASDTFFGSRIDVPSTGDVKKKKDPYPPTVGQQIGLGGFYMILKVNSKLESGSFKTTLDCRHQSDGLPPKKSSNKCEKGVERVE